MKSLSLRRRSPFDNSVISVRKRILSTPHLAEHSYSTHPALTAIPHSFPHSTGLSAYKLHSTSDEDEHEAIESAPSLEVYTEHVGQHTMFMCVYNNAKIS